MRFILTVVALVSGWLRVSQSPKTTSIHVESSSGSPAKVELIGGGGTVRLLKASGQVSKDTIVTEAPVDFVVDLSRGAVDIRSHRDTTWVMVSLQTPNRGNLIRGEARRLRVQQIGTVIELRGVSETKLAKP
jgi:hypothetical protein